MEDSRFDALARRLGRRRLLGSALSGVGAILLGRRSASAAASLTLTPVTSIPGLGGVRPGWKIRAVISGYVPNESVTVRWFDGPTAVTLKTFTANSSGGGSTTFIVPETYAGAHQVRFRGASGRYADSLLIVVPKLVLPTTARRGASVTASLSGFSPNSSYRLLWYETTDLVSDRRSVVCVETNAKGSGKGSFSIPADEPLGNHFVAPTGGCSGRTLIMTETGRTVTVTCPSGYAPDGSGGCCRNLFTSCSSDAQCCTGNCVSGKCRPVLVS